MTYSLEEAKYHVRATALELKKEGLIVRTWGNVSARVDENTFVITPTGRDFEGMTNEDIVTVNPYLGIDGVKPFVDVCKANDRGIFVLVKTSNPSSVDFQDKVIVSDGGNRRLFEEF